jgi:HSP20 family protein
MATKVMTRAPEATPAPAARAGRTPFFDMERPMTELWNRFFGENLGMPMFQAQPAMDLVEKNEEFVITTDLPGMKLEDIDIQVTANAVTVCGERNEQKEEKGAAYHRLERRYGRFSRTMSLPCNVVPDECEARYVDGVLTITLPKSEEHQARKIEIRK